MRRNGTLIGLTAVATLALLASGCCALRRCPVFGGSSGASWKQKLDAALPVFGHRNWVCIVDSAYPAQSRASIETVATGQAQLDVVKAALEAVDAAPHVNPIVYLDAELDHVADADAPGIAAYRTAVKKLLEGRTVKTLAHEDIIAKLDEAGKTFRVLILKTDLVLPYTSVFLELDCGYWGPAKEKKLRDAMPKAK
ncbi:hypothetical protein HQ576_02215 [bacterium]|nr:hypothetical protein [bacterium]